MPHDVIATCPVCGGELLVTRLRCVACDTTIEGSFGAGRFARLGREQFGLLESFLRSRGNLRDMERELGLSYPTVRARVDALVRALGLGPDSEGSDLEPDGAAGGGATEPSAGATTRREILERLARHEIDAVEAAAAIRALGRGA